MNTLGMVEGFSRFFVPIGFAGAGIAVCCALVALFALARGAAGLCGGACGVWIVGALLSMASSFSNNWIPVLISGGALAAALVLGGMLRGVLPRRGEDVAS